MKKLLIIAVLAMGFTSMYASNNYSANTETEFGRYYRYNGNISPDELPGKVIKYLDKHFSDYSFVVCKRKGNGYYFVKIRYAGNGYRPFYRSLVFDPEGRVIKG